MAEGSKRTLHHGPLRAPSHPAKQTSYSETTRTTGDLLVEKRKKSQVAKGRAVPLLELIEFLLDIY